MNVSGLVEDRGIAFKFFGVRGRDLIDYARLNAG